LSAGWIPCWPPLPSSWSCWSTTRISYSPISLGSCFGSQTISPEEAYSLTLTPSSYPLSSLSKIPGRLLLTIYAHALVSNAGRVSLTALTRTLLGSLLPISMWSHPVSCDPRGTMLSRNSRSHAGTLLAFEGTNQSREALPDVLWVS
jgi:hypothetical protein